MVPAQEITPPPYILTPWRWGWKAPSGTNISFTCPGYSAAFICECRESNFKSVEAHVRSASKKIFQWGWHFRCQVGFLEYPSIRVAFNLQLHIYEELIKEWELCFLFFLKIIRSNLTKFICYLNHNILLQFSIIQAPKEMTHVNNILLISSNWKKSFKVVWIQPWKVFHWIVGRLWYLLFLLYFYKLFYL